MPFFGLCFNVGVCYYTGLGMDNLRNRSISGSHQGLERTQSVNGTFFRRTQSIYIIHFSCRAIQDKNVTFLRVCITSRVQKVPRSTTNPVVNEGENCWDNVFWVNGKPVRIHAGNKEWKIMLSDIYQQFWQKIFQTHLFFSRDTAVFRLYEIEE